MLAYPQELDPAANRTTQHLRTPSPVPRGYLHLSGRQGRHSRPGAFRYLVAIVDIHARDGTSPGCPGIARYSASRSHARAATRARARGAWLRCGVSVLNATLVQICGHGSARPLSSGPHHGRDATDRRRRGPRRADARDRRADSHPGHSPDRARHGIRAEVEDAFFNSVIPSRVDHLIGFTPTTFAIHPPGKRVVPIEVQVGGRTYRFVFGNAAAVVGPRPHLLRNMIRRRRYPSPEGVFLDRRLTAAERRHVEVRADLGRDADVLVVARAPGMCFGRVARGGSRDRRGHDSHMVGGRRPRAGERGRDLVAPRRDGPEGRWSRASAQAGRRRRERRPRGTAGLRGGIRGPVDRRGDELVASPDVPGHDVRGPGRRVGAK